MLPSVGGHGKTVKPCSIERESIEKERAPGVVVGNREVRVPGDKPLLNRWHNSAQSLLFSTVMSLWGAISSGTVTNYPRRTEIIVVISTG